MLGVFRVIFGSVKGLRGHSPFKWVIKTYEEAGYRQKVIGNHYKLLLDLLISMLKLDFLAFLSKFLPILT